MDQLMDTDDLIKDEDLVASGSCKGQPGQPGQKDAASLLSDMTGQSIIAGLEEAAISGSCVGPMIHKTSNTAHEMAFQQ